MRPLVDRFQHYGAILGAADDLSIRTQQVQTLTDAYYAWADRVSEIADTVDDSTGDATTLRNLVASAGRILAQLLKGDTSKADAFQSTMNNTVAYAQQVAGHTLPTLQDVYDTTVHALHDLVVGTLRTAGEAAGSAIKAAADAANVDINKLETDATSTIKIVAAAFGLGAVVYLVSLLKGKK